MANEPHETKLGKEKKEKVVKNTDFYTRIGSKGGSETVARKGAKFFSEIATLRHQRNREARAAILKQSDDKPTPTGE